jgi:hypothetical protein
MFDDTNVKAFDVEEYKAERGAQCLKNEMDIKIAQIEPLMRTKCSNMIAREVKKIQKDFSQKHKILLNKKKNVEKKLEKKEAELEKAATKKKPVIVDEMKALKIKEIKVLRDELEVIQKQLKGLRDAKQHKTEAFATLKQQFDKGKETLKTQMIELEEYKAKKTLADLEVKKEKAEAEMMAKYDKPNKPVSPATMAERIKKMNQAKAILKGEREMMGMEDIDIGNGRTLRLSPKAKDTTRKLSPTSAAAFSKKMAAAKAAKALKMTGLTEDEKKRFERVIEASKVKLPSSSSVPISSVSSKNIEDKKTNIDELLKTTRARRDEAERLKGEAWRNFQKIHDSKSSEKKMAKKTYEQLKKQFSSLEKQAKTLRKKETKINDILKKKGIKTKKVAFKTDVTEVKLSPGSLETKKRDILGMIRSKLGLKEQAETEKKRARETYNAITEKTQKKAAKTIYDAKAAELKQIEDELKALRAKQTTINIKLGKSTKKFTEREPSPAREPFKEPSPAKEPSPVKEPTELELLLKQIKEMEQEVIELKALIPEDKTNPERKQRVRAFNAKALEYKALKEKIENMQK